MCKRSVIITVLIGLVIAGLMFAACDGDDSGTPTATAVSPTPTDTSTPTPSASLTPTTTIPTPTPTSTPTPTHVPTTCEVQRDSIQVALDSYHSANGRWPTADGAPGDIDWDKLVPAFLAEIPSLDGTCEWQVNSQPEGKVCLLKPC
ncbi:MAG: hypothetical protein PHV74_04300 [Dehalococcoidia bacterium]|nr:hypothetical protein [Dehalococcoidia bacterium]